MLKHVLAWFWLVLEAYVHFSEGLVKQVSFLEENWLWIEGFAKLCKLLTPGKHWWGDAKQCKHILHSVSTSTNVFMLRKRQCIWKALITWCKCLFFIPVCIRHYASLYTCRLLNHVESTLPAVVFRLQRHPQLPEYPNSDCIQLDAAIACLTVFHPALSCQHNQPGCIFWPIQQELVSIQTVYGKP